MQNLKINHFKFQIYQTSKSVFKTCFLCHHEKKTCIYFCTLKMSKKNAKYTRATKKRIADSMIDSKVIFFPRKTKSLIGSQKHYTREKKRVVNDRCEVHSS